MWAVGSSESGGELLGSPGAPTNGRCAAEVWMPIHAAGRGIQTDGLGLSLRGVSVGALLLSLAIRAGATVSREGGMAF